MIQSLTETKPQSKQLPENQSTCESQLGFAVAVARFIERNLEEKVTLALLAECFTTSPAQLRRRFLAVFGITPKAFYDGLRLGHFKRFLRDTDNVTDAAYLAGFQSLSRVHGNTPHQLGMPPGRYAKGGLAESIHYAFGETTLGLLLMAATSKGVCFAEFGNTQAELLSQLATEFPQAQREPMNAQQQPLLSDWVSALAAELEGSPCATTIPLDLRGTALQIQVWTFLTQIPKGQTLSYQAVADQLERPKAVRAIASACGRNRIAVLIPCHRVLRSDGGLGGYRWGLDRKRQLLNNENPSK